MTKRKKSTFERLQTGSLNRSQRREWAHRLERADPALEVVHAHAAGIDIGSASHFVAVPADRDGFLDLNDPDTDLFMLTTNGFSNKESAWFRVRR